MQVDKALQRGKGRGATMKKSQGGHSVAKPPDFDTPASFFASPLPTLPVATTRG